MAKERQNQPPLATGAAHAEQQGSLSPTLPVPPTPLIGREQERTHAQALLTRSGMRLLTITGPPGIGKTRLAVQVATDRGAACAGRVVFVPLAPLRDPDLLLPTIAHALGTTEGSGQSVRDRVVAALRPTPTLLVLDNFEQIVGAAPVVAELLAACPSLTALVTSRTLLHLRGEHILPVPPLALPSPAPLPAVADLATCEAVALFVARARAVQPDFALTEANAAAVAGICTRLDGVPLAIELAVDRLKLFPPAELLARLVRCLPWLTDGPRDLPTRQQTLRAALAWSEELLSPVERRVFRRLAAFVGGWTTDAALAVCAAHEDGDDAHALHALTALLDASLVRRDGATAHEARFGMLEVVREYAQERLAASGEQGEVERRHAAFFLALAARAEPHLFGAAQAAWLERLEREHDNLRAALARMLAAGEAGEALRLCAHLRNFWLVRDHLGEGRRWLAASLAGADTSAPPALRAKGCNSLATFALRQGDYEQARAWYEAGLALAREADDPRVIAPLLLNLGSAALVREDVAQARGRFMECLALSRRTGERREIARALNQLGETARFCGDDAEAATFYAESLALWRELGETERIAMVLHNLAPVVGRRGDAGQAVALFAESLALSWQLRSVHGGAICLAGLAGFAAACGEAADAARMLGAAEALRASIGVLWEPTDRAEYTRSERAARSRLGADRYDTLCREGQTFPFARIVGVAQACLSRLHAQAVPPAPPPPAVVAGGLTRRERDVVALIAQGKGNREIANALFIAEKTVEMHVSNCLHKLGFRSRTQLAMWVVARTPDHTTEDVGDPR